MMKKPDLARDTVAELFLTAFNGAVFNRGALERIPAAEHYPDEELRWFRQSFTGPTDFELFVGISTEAAKALPPELKVVLDNAFRTMARALAAVAGSAIASGALVETSSSGPEHVAYELCRESVRLGRVILAVPQATLAFLGGVIQSAPAPGTRAPLHLDALMNVDLPVSISFGTTDMLLADVLKLTTGSIVEFNHLLNEPVSVVVNGCLVARGDVVVVDGNYGVRISEVVAAPQ